MDGGILVQSTPFYDNAWRFTLRENIWTTVNPPPEGLSRPPLSKDWAILEISPERNYTTNAKVGFFTENVKNFLSAFYEPAQALYMCALIVDKY